ncbi:MAG: hypothetical protein EHM55_14640, partial [Acidobacteria bacterium]
MSRISRMLRMAPVAHVLLVAAMAVIATGTSAGAQAPDTARVRAAFLKMIDRPRVTLAAESRPRVDAGIYRAERFSFASEAGERVPGIFLKSVRATDRRPAIVLLHGTGSRKEELLGTMRTLADRGFVSAVIDSRHHGERITTGSDNDQYYAAMLETYRTGKGRPYLYDTVWDVMRLIDYLQTRADVDGTRIGIMGISKGGTEAYLAAAVDPRIVAAVPVIGVQGYRWALDNNQWQPRISTFAPPVRSAARDEGVKEVDAAFVRRFQLVRIAEPDFDAAMEICRSWARRIEERQAVVFSDEAVEAAVRLSAELIRARALPDKAIDLLENAATRATLTTLSPRAIAPGKEA